MSEKLLTIVIPVFNEEEVVSETVKRLMKLEENIKTGWHLEFIFVDDGSRDATLEILSGVAASDRRVKVIALSRNFGHQIALTAGIDLSKGDYVAVIDADLQDPPELIIEMLEIAETGYDVVYGKRISRRGESWLKKLSAYLFYRFINFMSDTDLPRDTGDFRVMSRRVVDGLSGMRERHRYIRGMVPWLGFASFGFEYHREERFAGETKYPLRKIIKFGLEAVLSFSTAPLTMAVRLGAFVMFLGFLIGVWIVGLKIFTSVVVPGFASIVSLIIIFNGLQILLIGLVGLYVSRIFEETKGRPLYIVSTVINDE